MIIPLLSKGGEKRTTMQAVKHSLHQVRIGCIAVSAERGWLICYIKFGKVGLQEIGLQSRSATASLLIKNYQCMQEEI